MDNNGISSVEGLARLSFDCPTVRHVSLRNNRLASAYALDPLERLRLLELNVAGNPFCAQQPADATVAQLSTKHVYLQVLDGARVPGAKAVAAGSEPQCAPPFNEGSDGNDIAAQVVEAAAQLLEQEHKDPAAVARLYAPDAQFSLATSVLGRTVFPPAVFRLARANPDARSPAGATTGPAHNLFRGPERICGALNRLPPLVFDRAKTYHESLLSPALPGLASIYVSGTVNFRSTHLFSYARTLHVAAAAAAAVAVLSDHITFMPFHGGPAPATLYAPPLEPAPDAVAAAVAAVRKELSFQQQPQKHPQKPVVVVAPPAAAAVSAAPVQPAPVAEETPEQKREALMARLMKETKLNRMAAEDCLRCSDWDFERALAKFRDMNAKRQIPHNFFVVQCSDADVCFPHSLLIPCS